MWGLIFVFGLLVGGVIAILLSPVLGARSVAPGPAPTGTGVTPPVVPPSTIRLTASPPIICSGDVVALTWHSTNAERIEETNESAVAVESGGLQQQCHHHRGTGPPLILLTRKM